ncbi:MAG: hypothetical protein ACYCT0_07235, partial [Sulfobacillus sp.]
MTFTQLQVFAKVVERAALRKPVSCSLVPNIRFEVADTTTILNMVKEGLGITVVPQLSLPDFPLGIEIRE